MLSLLIMGRLFDLIAVAAVAVVVLLPKGSVEAKAALVGDKIELDRIAVAEDARYAEPDNVDAALELAQSYLQMDHPDWALATLQGFSARGDHRVHLLRATAFAERLQAAEAVAESQRALAACDAEGPVRCDATARVRIGVIAGPMQALVDAKIDATQNPLAARQAVGKVLHTTKPEEMGPRGKKKGQ
jgi:hypothetical protein